MFLGFFRRLFKNQTALYESTLSIPGVRQRNQRVNNILVIGSSRDSAENIRIVNYV